MTHPSHRACGATGRILNRFAKDVGHMDDNLPITFFDFVQVGERRLLYL